MRARERSRKSDAKSGTKWETPASRRQFLDNLKTLCSVEEVGDWKKVTAQDVRQQGGSGLLARYSGSVAAMLMDSYPEIGSRAECRPLRRPKSFWKDWSSRRQFLEEVAAAHSFPSHSAEGWRSITNAHIVQAGGSGLLLEFSSLLEALQDTFPEAQLSADAARPQKPMRYWSEWQHRRDFIDEVARKHGISKPADWRKVTSKDVLAMGGSTFLKQYGDSLFAALCDLYPEETFVEHLCRPRVSHGYWDDVGHQRMLLDEIARQHRVTEPTEWRKVTMKQFEAAGAGAVLRRYSSIYEMLCTAYSDIGEAAWDARQCRPHVPNHHWDQEENMREFLERVKEEFHVTEKEDWHRISCIQLREVAGGNTLVSKYSLLEMLQLAYPKEKWEDRRQDDQGRSKKSAQRRLTGVVARLFAQPAVSMAAHGQ